MPGIGFNPRFRAFNAAGTAPLAGGKLYSYAAGTTDAKALYTTAALSTAHDNPIVLNSAGECTFYMAPGGRYKLTLTDSADNVQTGWPIDYVDSNGIYLDDSADPYLLKWFDGTDTLTLGSAFTVANRYSAPRAMGAGYVGYGMVLSNNSGDADHDIDFTAGERADSTYGYHIIGSALTKKLDASWTAGTNQGMLRSGLTIASTTWYYIYAIYNPTTAVADYFADTGTTPTLPTGYTIYVMIGAILTDGSANIYPFKQIEHGKFIFNEPKLDYDVSNLSTTWVTVTLSVPRLADVTAHVSIGSSNAGAYLLYMANQDSDPTTGLTICEGTGAPAATPQYNALEVFPTSAAAIGVKSSAASTTCKVYTIGYEMKTWR